MITDKETQSNESITAECTIQNVTNRFFFYYEGEEDGWTFEVEAKDFKEAFELAYDTHGPQVEMMMYRLI